MKPFSQMSLRSSVGLLAFAAGLVMPCGAQCIQNDQIARLLASDRAADDNFGWSVAISFNTAVIGAHHDDSVAGVNSGSAYVYERVNGVWVQQAKLVASDISANDAFGTSVGISGNTIIVGAPLNVNSSPTSYGAAYIFTRSGTVWTQKVKLVGSDSSLTSRFGYSVDISTALPTRHLALVGDRWHRTNGHINAGAAYLFSMNLVTPTPVWTESYIFVAPDAAAGDEFGEDVALSFDSVAVIGTAYDDHSNKTDAGSIHIFSGDAAGRNWTYKEKKVANNPIDGGRFGQSVDVSGTRIMVGEPGFTYQNIPSWGRAYLIRKVSSGWVTGVQFSGAADGTFFGDSVAVDGDYILIGSPSFSSNLGGRVFAFSDLGSDIDSHGWLRADDASASDAFGSEVALGGGHLLIGAKYKSAGGVYRTGAAYVFDKNLAQISQQPQPQSLCAGETATMTFTADFNDSYNYRDWLKDGVRIAQTGPNGNPSAGTDTLVLSNINEADEGEYSVRLEQRCGVYTTQTAYLSVCACLECSADFNEDGGIDGTDIDDFFTKWSAGDCDADVNADGGVDGADIDVFFGAWSNGGC